MSSMEIHRIHYWCDEPSGHKHEKKSGYMMLSTVDRQSNVATATALGWKIVESNGRIVQTLCPIHNK